MKKILVSTVSALAILSLGGCGITLPTYEADPTTYQALKKADAKPVKVGEFTPATAKLGSLSIRTNPVKSPYPGTIIDYLEEALKIELDKAGLLSNESATEISGTVTSLDVDAASGTGTGELTVHFLITRAGQTVYDKSLKIDKTWDSSFMGAVAIPAAAAGYQAMARDLIQKLVSDPDFIKAIH